MKAAADSVNAPRVDVLVEAGPWRDEGALNEFAQRAIYAATTIARPPIPMDLELSLVLTDDAHVRILNRQYRAKDAATNVLSFPAPSPRQGAFGPLLGDIVVAEETVAREAADQGLAFDDHLTHLIVHGFLHILGYDHEDDAEAAVMEGMETRILADLGIADPYAGESV